MLYANTARAQFSADQHFTASTWSDITGQKQTTELAVIAPRKIALGSNFSCCSCDAGNMANTTEYRRKTEGTRREAFLILKEDLTANVFSNGFSKDF